MTNVKKFLPLNNYVDCENIVLCNRAGWNENQQRFPGSGGRGWDENKTDFKRKGGLQAVY